MKRTSGEGALFAGVAGGMARHFNIDPTASRLLWVIFFLCTAGLSVILYFLFAILLDSDVNSDPQ